MQPDLRFHLNHAGRNFNQPKSQSIELRHTPDRALRHGGTQGPQQPVGASVEEQAELVGGCPGAGSAVSGEMTLPGLDMIFGNAAPAIDMLVQRFRSAAGKVGDDEPGIGPLLADFRLWCLSPMPRHGGAASWWARHRR